MPWRALLVIEAILIFLIVLGALDLLGRLVQNVLDRNRYPSMVAQPKIPFRASYHEAGRALDIKWVPGQEMYMAPQMALYQNLDHVGHHAPGFHHPTHVHVHFPKKMDPEQVAADIMGVPPEVMQAARDAGRTILIDWSKDPEHWQVAK